MAAAGYFAAAWDLFLLVSRDVWDDAGPPVDVRALLPDPGVTDGFAESIWLNALDQAAGQERRYTFSGFVYCSPGLVVTSLSEAQAMFRTGRLDPSSVDVYQPNAETILTPEREGTRYVYGRADLPPFPGTVFFGLSYAGEVIAVGRGDQVTALREVHAERSLYWRISAAAQASRRKRAEANALWGKISSSLADAMRWPRFPGRCPLCP